MFNFRKNVKPASTPQSSLSSLQSMKVVDLKIEGMHCVSCAMTIDGELEDLPGVKSASTKYAQAVCTVSFDTAQVQESQLIQTIESLGYLVKKS